MNRLAPTLTLLLSLFSVNFRLSCVPMETENCTLAFIAAPRRLQIDDVTWGVASDLPTLTTVRGVKYTPLWMAWPVLDPTYSEFEKSKYIADFLLLSHVDAHSASR
jgi:hypothetical protein